MTLTGCGGGGGGGSDPELPNLVPVGGGSAGTLTAGTSYDVLVTVENQGDGNAGPSKLRFSTSNGDEHVEDVPAIAAGGSYSPTVSFTPEETDVGALTLTITADSAGQVEESDEGDNAASDTVTVVSAITKPAAN